MPLALILGTFFVVTLPMVWARQVLSGREFNLLVIGYFWLLSYTHFLLTFTIYLERANLLHFADGWRNRLAYFVVPAGLLVFFALYAAFGLAAYPLGGTWTLGLLVGPALRLADFNHFGSQSFGVLQLLKADEARALPRWMARAEKLYFGGLTLLLWLTYLVGDTFPLADPTAGEGPRAAAGLLLAATLAPLVAWVCGLLAAWRRAGRADGFWQPLAYLAVQSASAAIALVSLPFYGVSLAIHYVEYHVVMVPRCFGSPLDGDSALDRFYGRLRRDKRLFYGALLLLSALMVLAPAVRATPTYAALLRSTGGLSWIGIFFLFDGLAAMHYFVEGRIWRFSEPYYRARLGPLYLGATASVPPASSPAR